MGRFLMTSYAMAHAFQTDEAAFREKIKIVQSRDETFRRNNGKTAKVSLPTFKFQSKDNEDSSQ